MSVAIQSATRGEVRADSVDGSLSPFECAGCGVPVVYVGDYWTNKQDPDLARHVKAFFRLSKGRVNSHEDGCPNTPAGQLKVLVNEAQAVEDSVDPFVPGPDGLYVFRINIPAEEIQREAALSGYVPKAEFGQRVERIWTGRRIASFCRAATGLAKLWQSLESPQAQADLRKRVRIALNGKRISWDNFFFSSQRIGHFADSIETGPIGYPVALLLHAKEVRANKVVFTPVEDVKTNGIDWISVEAYAAPDILGVCAIGQHYMVFGDFRHSNTNPWPVPNSDKIRRYHNFRIRLYRSAQIDLVEVVDPMRE